MSYGEKQKKEIATIRERKISLNLSDADCDRVSELCGKHGISISQLLENFIGDVVEGTYTNGSDERDLVYQWFNRCWFGNYPKETLLKWLLDELIDVEGFLDLLDNIETAERDLDAYKKDPSGWDAEAIELSKSDLESWKEELIDYKSRYMQENSTAEWEKEIADVKRWFDESINFKEGICNINN